MLHSLWLLINLNENAKRLIVLCKTSPKLCLQMKFYRNYEVMLQYSLNGILACIKQHAHSGRVFFFSSLQQKPDRACGLNIFMIYSALTHSGGSVIVWHRVNTESALLCPRGIMNPQQKLFLCLSRSFLPTLAFTHKWYLSSFIPDY